MKCDQQALFRYTWAGRDESYCCLEHAQQIQGIAQAMGYYVQLIPLSEEEQMKASCSQEMRANAAAYRKARGVLPWKDGDELPEDMIRRSRGGR